MKTYKTTAERLHRICIKAQTSARHGLTLHRFGLICAMRGYHIVECHHPEHKPPTHLALPRGVFYTHTCPSCGARAGLTAPNVTLKGK